jgi:hypothetical protein
LIKLRRGADARFEIRDLQRAITYGTPAHWLLGVLGCLWAPAALAADGCPTKATDIATDRPSVTNSSLVVPTGSLQSENGVNLSERDGGSTIDGTNSRLRLGVAPCLEFLVDLPDYFGAVQGAANSGFTDVSPAIKWQLGPLPGKFDLAMTAGVALPTGNAAIAGPGAQPYLQFPWSRDLGLGFGIGGMVSAFFHPADPSSKLTTETTFVLQKKLDERATLFVEYIGDYPDQGGSSQLFNSGGVYQLTRTQQVDFHVAFGLNHNAPAYILGVGYSHRLDGLF